MRTEISVTIEVMDTDFLWVWHTVAIAVAVIFKPNGTLAVVAAEKVTFLALVTSSYEFFESKRLKVMAEIMEEITDAWIITIAQHRFSFEMLFIVL